MEKMNIHFIKYLMGVAIIISFLFSSIFIGCAEDPMSPPKDDNQLKYVTPEDVGYSSVKLEEAEQLAEQSGYAAMMALYDGQVFFSWGEVERNFWCHSIRKSFLNALYGIHVAQGNIDIDATLEELGIDDIPSTLTNEEKQAKVRDLLKSRSGIYIEAAAETQEMKDIRPERGSHDPNTFFYYNNWDFNALGTIFEQEAGAEIFEEFKRKIADPLGMEDFNIDNCYYQYELNLSMHPAYCFRMSARDMARFGVLYQKNGMYKNKQIIDPAWITESTNVYSIFDSIPGVGYGYLWAVIPENSAFAEVIGSSGYYHTGVALHVLMILPEQKLVIVLRYDTDGNWTAPVDDVKMEIGLMIINAKIVNKD